jgi:hypothetical protein
MTVLALISASRPGVSYRVGQAIIKSHQPLGPCGRCRTALVGLEWLRRDILPDAAVEQIIDAAVDFL